MDGDDDDVMKGNECFDNSLILFLYIDKEGLVAVESGHRRVYHHQLAVGAVTEREKWVILV